MKQSEEAKQQGVCHTKEECVRGYAELPDDKKRPAIEMLKVELEQPMAEIRAAIACNPRGWVGPYHLGWGMSVRNLLRENGFGEEWFGIDNLDCIYTLLIEEAVRA